MGAQNIPHPGCYPGSEPRGKHPGNFAGIPQVKQTASFHPDRLSVLKENLFHRILIIPCQCLQLLTGNAGKHHTIRPGQVQPPLILTVILP